MNQVVELEVPARAEYVGLVRLVVSAVAAERRDLADDRIDDLKLAVSEACTNAVEANGHDGADLVTVRCLEDDERFEVRVEDHAGGFDPSALPVHPPVTDPARLEYERGLGIPLIRALVDDVQFDTSEAGTSVRMIVYCGKATSAG